MALNKTALEKALKNVFTAERDPETAAAKAAAEIAKAIDDYVKTAKVTVVAPTGAISVVGSPSAQSNAQPITITGEVTMGGGLS